MPITPEIPPVVPTAQTARMDRTIGQTLVGLQQFSGKPQENVAEFFAKLRQRATIDAWTEAQTLAVARCQITGDAFRFLESEPTLNRDDIRYADFVQAFKKKYSPTLIPGQAELELSRCVQKTQENVDQYSTRIKVVGKRLLEENLSFAEAGEVTAVKKRHERDLVNQFLKGADREIAQMIMLEVRKKPTMTFDEVIELAQKAEIGKEMLSLTRRTGDLYLVEAEQHRTAGIRTRQSTQINGQKIRNQSNYQNQRGYQQQRSEINAIKCFNCLRMGHKARDCRTSPSSRCFQCGTEGHFARDCRRKQHPISSQKRGNGYHRSSPRDNLNPSAPSFAPQSGGQRRQ